VCGVAVVMVSAMFTPAAAAPAGPVSLSSFRQALELPRTALSNKPPIRAQAVVTFTDYDYNLIFLHDFSAGIFLYRHTTPTRLAVGDWIEVEGVASPGLYANIVDRAQIRVLGRTNRPPARPMSIAALRLRAPVGEVVSVAGVVQRLKQRDNHLTLYVADGEGICPITFPWFAGYERLNLLDARVEVTGVAAASFKNDLLTGFELHANTLADIRILEPAPSDPFARRPTPISELLDYSPQHAWEHRVHVSGVVTLHWSNRLAALRDAGGTLWIEEPVGSGWHRGDRVSAVGFLLPASSGPRMKNAELRKVGPGTPATSVPFEWRNRSLLQNHLVQLTARITDWQTNSAGRIAADLETQEGRLVAELPSSTWPSLPAASPAGAVVSATGVLRMSRVDGRDEGRPILYVQEAGAWNLLQPAPSSPAGIFPIAIGGGVVVGAALVICFLQRRACQQRELRARGQFEEMQQALARSQREREVVSRELHDNILQSIYSVGLGLDEVRRTCEQQPHGVAERITVAINSLNGLIRDLRSFLTGLEPKGIGGAELKGALKSVLLAAGPDEEARFSIQIEPSAAHTLSRVQATEIFNIAREAISNCLRHARAANASVTLHAHARGIRLVVADDGVGFDLAMTKDASMGFRNMRNRASVLGATLDIDSAPGQGTTVNLDIPNSAHDSH